MQHLDQQAQPVNLPDARMQRRRFLRTAGGAAVTAASAARVAGANSRLRIALVGCGGRGKSVAAKAAAVEGAEYGYFCDVYDKQAEAAREELAGGVGELGKDFRRVMDDKDIDAVHVATPDHWHALPAVAALEAGKHVYVEKPLGHNVLEGKAMVAAAARSKAVFLTGTQHRSAPHLQEAAEIVQSGALQDVHFVRVWNYANLMPVGPGEKPDSDPPPGLDWDFYLGPAPWVPFNEMRFLRTYRMFFDYAGGWITDFGTHRFDTVHQIMGEERPKSVVAAGGRFAVGGMGDQPDLLQVTLEYPGFVLSYETCNINSFGSMGRLTPGMPLHGARAPENRPNGMVFYGSNGTLIVDRLGYEIIPETGAYGGSLSDKDAFAKSRLKRMHKSGSEPSQLHAEHFVRCVRDGEPPRSEALTGHRSSLVAHLGNIAYHAGRKLKWDSEREDFEGDAEASRMLGRKARKPWDAISI